MLKLNVARTEVMVGMRAYHDHAEMRLAKILDVPF
jgi:hypothetical protein